MPELIKGWRNPIAYETKQAALISDWQDKYCLLWVPRGFVPFVRGAVALWGQENIWEGSQAEIDNALQVVIEFTAQPGVTEVIMDVELRVSGDGLSVEYRWLNLEGEWSEWLLAGPLLPGPQGEQGERFFIYGDREAPNSYMTLYSQRQEIDNLGEWQNIGEPVEIGPIFDGWVQVGFYLPTIVDNGNGTISFYRQYHCRVSAQSNTFLPSGEPELIGSAELPPGPRGPVGGHYLITSDNPQSNVAIFYRRYVVWNEDTEEWDYQGEYEEFGGIIAPPGPQGLKGDYYVVTADNPPGMADTVVLYRQLHSGTTGLAIGDIEEIGSAVAVQGPPGEQGIQGPPGSITGWTPSEEWLTVTEWQRLSWYAYRLMAWATEVIVRQIQYEQIGVTGALVGAHAAAALVGFAVAGPPGAAAGFILSVGVDIIGVIGAVAAQSWLDQLQLENNRQAIAQGLYCSLIPARYLDVASLQAWVDNHVGADPIALLNNNDGLGCVEMAIANHWQEIGMVNAQKELTMILLEYHYDAAIDYTSLPCTPNIGGSQEVFDFTISNQGWQLFTAYGSFGEYVQGVGWIGTYRGGEGDVVGIWRNEPVSVTYVEVLYDLDAKSSTPGQPGVHLGESGNFTYEPEPTIGVNQVWSRDFGGGEDLTDLTLWFAPWASNAGIIIKRISITYV